MRIAYKFDAILKYILKAWAAWVDDVRGDREAVFQPEFLEDLEYWVDKDLKMALRILKIVKEILRDPFEGICKPEPLKYEYCGCWSRRINQKLELST